MQILDYIEPAIDKTWNIALHVFQTWVDKLQNYISIPSIYQAQHIYPTPQSESRPIVSNIGCKIDHENPNINLFNNGSFFILLQIMILIYIPASSCLTPFYESDPCLNCNPLNPLNPLNPSPIADSLEEFSKHINNRLDLNGY